MDCVRLPSAKNGKAMQDKEKTMTKKTKSKAAGSKKDKAPKVAAKAAKVKRDVTKPAVAGAVYPFPTRFAGATIPTMETLMTQKKHQFDRMAQEAGLSQKEQMDALMQSGNIAMKGFEDIFKTCMQMAQTSAEKNAQAMKSIFGCKTLNEFTEAQNRIAQQGFDDFMVTTTRLSELAVKMATDAFEPINDQFSRTIKKASEAVAA